MEQEKILRINELAKMKKGDNQSGNSTILGVCRQWIRWQGKIR